MPCLKALKQGPAPRRDKEVNFRELQSLPFGLKQMQNKILALIFVFATFVPAHADAALLLEEPYGTFGALNPTGHAAVYLTRICAASFTRVRRCEPGETGVVISRYHKIAGYDWIAIPLLPYLYAVDTLQEIPQSADGRSAAALREKYRQAHLLAIARSDAGGRGPKGEWIQLVGSSYDRTIYGFRFETSPEQDNALIQQLNDRKNKSHFNLFSANCADFARTVMNLYDPHAVHRNFFADAGVTTPKQVAKSLVTYSRHHPDLAFYSFRIPQVPGSIHRSKPVDGVVESLLKTKKYMLPLAILHPAVAGGLVVDYLAEGRFNPKRNAVVFDVARAAQSESAGATVSMVDASNSASRITAATVSTAENR
jgi:hypothetical protein